MFLCGGVADVDEAAAAGRVAVVERVTAATRSATHEAAKAERRKLKINIKPDSPKGDARTDRPI
jgi:hypothetical protein